jgi:hypothetical protein
VDDTRQIMGRSGLDLSTSPQKKKVVGDVVLSQLDNFARQNGLGHRGNLIGWAVRL